MLPNDLSVVVLDGRESPFLICFGAPHPVSATAPCPLCGNGSCQNRLIRGNWCGFPSDRQRHDSMARPSISWRHFECINAIGFCVDYFFHLRNPGSATAPCPLRGNGSCQNLKIRGIFARVSKRPSPHRLHGAAVNILATFRMFFFVCLFF